MRNIKAKYITEAVKYMCISSNYYLSYDIKKDLKNSYKDEDWYIKKDKNYLLI